MDPGQWGAHWLIGCAWNADDADNAEDNADDDEDGDDADDIYIMMKCLSVCNEKSSLPPGSLL